jgi:ankyrin repeat protein
MRITLTIFLLGMFSFVCICNSVGAESVKVSDYFPLKAQAELAIAAEKGKTAKISTMLQAGADINAAGKDGMTVLLWCFLHQNKTAFEYLLEHGANPNAQMQSGAARVGGDLGLAGMSVIVSGRFKLTRLGSLQTDPPLAVIV